MYLSIFMKYRHEFIAPCKGVWIPECGKILLVESGIQATAQGIRNPTKRLEYRIQV